MVGTAHTLGALMRGLRSQFGWTLKEMSEKSGIPFSTLAKVEHDRLTLSYDKLYQVSQRLGLRMSEMFAEPENDAAPTVTARRSYGDIQQALRVETPNYDYYYLCTDLRRKRMIPALIKIRAKTLAEFGELARHAGEEFIYVTRGSIVMVTEFYDSVELHQGESMYIDSSMGHAFLTADGCDEAEIMTIMSSGDEELLASLLNIHEEKQGGVRSEGPARRTGARRARGSEGAT